MHCCNHTLPHNTVLRGVPTRPGAAKDDARLAMLQIVTDANCWIRRKHDVPMHSHQNSRIAVVILCTRRVKLRDIDEQLVRMAVEGVAVSGTVVM